MLLQLYSVVIAQTNTVQKVTAFLPQLKHSRIHLLQENHLEYKIFQVYVQHTFLFQLHHDMTDMSHNAIGLSVLLLLLHEIHNICFFPMRLTANLVSPSGTKLLSVT